MLATRLATIIAYSQSESILCITDKERDYFDLRSPIRWKSAQRPNFCCEFVFCFCFFILLAQISFPYGHATYWLPGSSVKLPWEIKFSSSDIFVVQWSFTRSGSTQTKDLAAQFLTSAPGILDQTYSIIDGATLVFQNANLSHNGTYTLAVTLRASAGGNTVRSNVLVIILGKKSIICIMDVPSPDTVIK